jgi:hypothetical protein
MEQQLAGEHPYSYVENNPVTFVDPLGLQTQHTINPISECERKCGDCIDRSKEKAEKLMKLKFGTVPHRQDYYNAVAHCTAACIIARDCPLECFDVIQRREHGIGLGWIDPRLEDQEMDFINNGIGLALSFLGGQCIDQCIKNAHLLKYRIYSGGKSW